MPDDGHGLSYVLRSPLTAAELRGIVEQEVRHQVDELVSAAGDRLNGELEELRERVAGLERRLTEVHERALRALTDTIARGQGGR